jgi:hypothetical protein
MKDWWRVLPIVVGKQRDLNDFFLNEWMGKNWGGKIYGWTDGALVPIGFGSARKKFGALACGKGSRAGGAGTRSEHGGGRRAEAPAQRIERLGKCRGKKWWVQPNTFLPLVSSSWSSRRNSVLHATRFTCFSPLSSFNSHATSDFSYSLINSMNTILVGGLGLR